MKDDKKEGGEEAAIAELKRPTSNVKHNVRQRKNVPAVVAT